MGRRPEKKHIGKIFGKLTIIDQIPGKKSICKCECGNIKIIATANVTIGHITSCGCLRSIFRVNYDEDAKNKLLSHIDIKDNGCWEWNRAKHRQGYGHFPYKRKLMLAHRASWIIFNGKLDNDICVCHRCDNPPCVNPNHLFLGTTKENIHDCIKKGKFTRCIGSDKPNTNLDDITVKEIIRMRKDGCKYVEIQRITGATKGQIQAILHNRTWKHIPR